MFPIYYEPTFQVHANDAAVAAGTGDSPAANAEPPSQPQFRLKLIFRTITDTVLCVGAVVATIVPFVLGSETRITGNPDLLLVGGLVQAVAFGVMSYWRIRQNFRAGLTMPPLPGATTAHAVRSGVLTGVALAVFAYVYVMAAAKAIGFDALSRPDVAMLLGTTGWRLTCAAALLIVLAPLSEEGFFRFAVFGSFATNGYTRTGTLASAALFTAGHCSLAMAPVYMVDGVVLPWLWIRSRSAVAPIVAHMTINAIAVLPALLLR